MVSLVYTEDKIDEFNQQIIISSGICERNVDIYCHESVYSSHTKRQKREALDSLESLSTLAHYEKRLY